jgi:hypothetical protein
MSKISLTTKPITFNLEEIAECFALGDEREQAEFLSIVAHEFNSWPVICRDNQLLELSRFITPDAKQWLIDLMEFIETEKENNL